MSMYGRHSSASATYSPTCLSLKTCCTRPQRRRREDTRRSVWCRAQTRTSWTSSVQDATRSPRCSATRRRWCCVWAAPPCCASPPGGKLALQKVAPSEESSTRSLVSDPCWKRAVRPGWTLGISGRVPRPRTPSDPEAASVGPPDRR